MKTLKKSLCLILALVFVLGLCTIGAGAAFTDDADINYGDAVAVMQGLGILKGYEAEDGTFSFQPAKTVTRAEAAKMITYMILGEKYAEKLTTAKVFDDVAADHWAAKYINYCAGKGIIKGYGDGNYGPNDPVTGIQMAKMLLVACGYGAMGEFGPDNWDVNAFSYAVENRVFAAAETESFEEAATREETALYVFNTLRFTGLVKYDVDMNDYDNKTYKIHNAAGEVEYVNETFGHQTWDLASVDGMVIENQATGEDYTIVAPYYENSNGDGDFYFGASNLFTFDAKSGAELIGHKVTVYYNTTEKKDADKNYYYSPYLVSDISTVYSTSDANPFVTKTLGALAKEMNYPETDFADVEFFSDGNHSGSLLGTMTSNISFTTFQPYKNLFFKGVYNLAKDTEVYDLSNAVIAGYQWNPGQIRNINGKSDGASSYLPVDSLIVDEFGEIISAVKTSYAYGKVIAVDEVEELVDYEICEPVMGSDNKQVKDASGNPVFKYTADNALLENCYEGIAKDDFVIIEKYGDVVTLTGTTTQTMSVSKIDKSFFTTFNGTLYAEFAAPTWSNKFVDDEDGIYLAPGDVQVGQTVKFLVGKNGMAFAAVLLEDGTSSYIYVTSSYRNEAKSYGKTVYTYMIQAVDGEGNVIDLVTGYSGTTSFGKEYSANETKKLYKAVDRVDAKTGISYVELKTDANIQSVAPDAYKGTESHIKGKAHYLTSATNFLYINGENDTLKVNKGSSLHGNIAKAYYVAKDTTATDVTINVPTVWVIGEEMDVYAGKYIFAKAATKSAGTTDVNGSTYPYYNIYIDGVPTTINLKDSSVAQNRIATSVFDTAAEDGFYYYLGYTYEIPWGATRITINQGMFYTYAVDSSDLYVLTVAPTEGATVISMVDQNVTAAYDDQLIVYGLGTDIDLSKVVLVDLTDGYQDARGFSKTYTDGAAIAEALKLGYTVKVSFMYDTHYDLPIEAVYVTVSTPATK